jgi:hypothetical protein
MEGSVEKVYVSAHGSMLPNKLPHPSTPVSSPLQVFHPHWLRDDRYYLAFTPRSISEADTIFEGLSYAGRNPSITSAIEKDHKGEDVRFYRVELAQKWNTLENMLYLIVNKLQAGQSASLDFQSPWWPSKYGFAERYHFKDGARTAALKARAAFYCVIAYASFLTYKRKLQRGTTGWGSGVDSDLLTFIQNCCISQSTPRIGGFVEVTSEKAQYMDELCHIVPVEDVPLWFCYGPVDRLSQLRFLVPTFKDLYPSASAVQVAQGSRLRVNAEG